MALARAFYPFDMVVLCKFWTRAIPYTQNKPENVIPFFLLSPFFPIFIGNAWQIEMKWMERIHARSSVYTKQQHKKICFYIRRDRAQYIRCVSYDWMKTERRGKSKIENKMNAIHSIRSPFTHISYYWCIAVSLYITIHARVHVQDQNIYTRTA